MNNLKKHKNIAFLFFVLTTLIGCTENENIFVSKDTDIYYKIIYKKDTILYIKGYNMKEKKYDTTYFYKEKNNFFQNIPTLSGTEKSLVLSKKDTLFNYKVINSDFYCKISKLKEKEYSTSFGNSDSSKFKYNHRIYYNDNFEIQRITEINLAEKLTFEKK